MCVCGFFWPGEKEMWELSLSTCKCFFPFSIHPLRNLNGASYFSTGGLLLCQPHRNTHGTEGRSSPLGLPQGLFEVQNGEGEGESGRRASAPQLPPSQAGWAPRRSRGQRWGTCPSRAQDRESPSPRIILEVRDAQRRPMLEDKQKEILLPTAHS